MRTILTGLEVEYVIGGYNVYPRNNEEVLYQHPAVKEAGVVGTTDEYRGETAIDFIVLKDDLTATEEEIIAHCAEHLAKDKVPSRVIIRSALPMTAVGKALRRELAKDLSD